jgi:hypothetical protein
MFSAFGDAHLMNREGYLVPFTVKLRLLIDNQGELFLVLISKARKDRIPVAYFEGNKIINMSKTFENVILGELEMP